VRGILLPHPIAYSLLPSSFLRARPDEAEQRQEVAEGDHAVAAIEGAEVIRDIAIAAGYSTGARPNQAEQREEVAEAHQVALHSVPRCKQAFPARERPAFITVTTSLN